MSVGAKNKWSNPDDEQWGREFLQCLSLMPSISTGLANEVLLEVQLDVSESGLGASKLYGSPAAFAEEVRRQRVPVEIRAGVGRNGIATKDRIKVLLTAVGLIGTSLSVGFFIVSGWLLAVTPPGLALTVGGILALVGAHLGLRQRHVGQVRCGWAWWFFGLAGLVAFAFVAAAVPARIVLFQLPILLPFLVSLLSLVIAERLPYSSSPVKTFSDQSPRVWFDELAGVLRGRYHLPRLEAQRHVAEAQSFWREGGSSHPCDEFGSPEVYALEILEYSDMPRRTFSLREAWLYAAIAMACVVLAVDALVTDGLAWNSLFFLGAVGLFGSLAARHWSQ